MNYSLLGVLLALIGFAIGCGATNDKVEASPPTGSPLGTAVGKSNIEISPITHATFILRAGQHVVYNDPVGGSDAFANHPAPTLVLVSDIHGDHLDSTTLEQIVKDSVQLVVPRAVAERLSPKLAAKAYVLENGDELDLDDISITAIPMYNLRQEALQFHPKGRGNGYLIEVSGERIYIAGDTEGIPEMTQLKNIDRAFIPMNLPYTMPVDAAAEAVIAFAPRKVYPYHFRGKSGLSDTAAFRRIIGESNVDTELVALDWYSE